MTVSLCPLCQSSLRMFARHSVECDGWNCDFKIVILDSFIIEAAMAHHMRPLAEPHAFKANPDYPGQCDHPIQPLEFGPVEPCNRPKECHQ